MTNMTRRTMLTGVAAVATLGTSRRSFAQKYRDPGVTDTSIKIGTTMPFSGPASAYSVIGRSDIAYFDMVNEKGGINGRKVELIALDDAYSPPKTVEAVRRLVEQEEVLFLFNNLGTAANSAVQKYINGRKIPHLFLTSGASKWGRPKEFPWTIGWQPPYSAEAQIFAKHILANVPSPKIAVLMQNDDFGKDYYEGFQKGLGGKEMIASFASYEISDPTVDSQLVKLRSSDANVFFNITSPKFAAQTIRKMAEINWKPKHYLNGTVASLAVLKPAGLENCQDIISAAYLKDPNDPQWANHPDYKEWRAWMEKYNKSANVIDANAAYGYAVSYTMHKVLERCGDDLTRDNIMRQATSLTNLAVPMLLPGITVKTSPDNYYPVKMEYLQTFKGETWQLFGDAIASD